MFDGSFPHQINSVDIDRSHLMVAPPFQRMHHPARMACMDHSSLHRILHSGQILVSPATLKKNDSTISSKLPRMIQSLARPPASSWPPDHRRCSPSGTGGSVGPQTDGSGSHSARTSAPLALSTSLLSMSALHIIANLLSSPKSIPNHKIKSHLCNLAVLCSLVLCDLD